MDHSENEPLALLGYTNQALILEKMGKFQKAIKTYKEIINLYGRTVNVAEFNQKITELRHKLQNSGGKAHKLPDITQARLANPSIRDRDLLGPRMKHFGNGPGSGEQLADHAKVKRG